MPCWSRATAAIVAVSHVKGLGARLRSHGHARPPQRTLGRTRLQVTTLGFGALELRGMVAGIGRPLMAGQPERILQAVLEAGINYIDVAVDYGEAEEHIGRCIAGRRHEFFLASKCGCPLDVSRFSPSERTRYGTPLPRLHDYSRQHITDAVDQSLRRMQTHYLDVLQFHFSPAKEVLEREGPSKRSRISSKPARFVSWVCPRFCRILSITSRWACSTSSRFPIRLYSQNTRQPLPKRPGEERASSSVEAWPAASQVRGMARLTSGRSGSRPAR